MFAFPRDRSVVDDSMLTFVPKGRCRQRTNAILGIGSHRAYLDLDGSVDYAKDLMADGHIPYPMAVITNGGDRNAHWEYLPGDGLNPVGDKRFVVGGGQLVFGTTGVFLPGSMHPITGEFYRREETGFEDSVWRNKHSAKFFGVSPTEHRVERATGGQGCGEEDGLLSALCHLDSDDSYAWMVVCAGLKGEYGEAGLDAFLVWSGTSSKFDLSENMDRWKRMRSRSGLGAIYNLAREKGWQGEI